VNANSEGHSEVQHYCPDLPVGQIKQVASFVFINHYGCNDPSQPIEKKEAFVRAEDPDVLSPL